MSYYQVLDGLKSLHDNGVKQVTTKDLSSMIGISDRAVRNSLSVLVRDGLVERVYIQGMKGGSTCYYKPANKNATEGFINDVFKIITSIIP